MRIEKVYKITNQIIISIFKTTFYALIIFMIYNIFFLILGVSELFTTSPRIRLIVGLYLLFTMVLILYKSLLLKAKVDNIGTQILKIVTIALSLGLVIQLITGFMYSINGFYIDAELEYLSYILFTKNIHLLYTILIYLIFVLFIPNSLFIEKLLRNETFNLTKYERIFYILFFTLSSLALIMWCDETKNYIYTNIVIYSSLLIGSILIINIMTVTVKNYVKKR